MPTPTQSKTDIPELEIIDFSNSDVTAKYGDLIRNSGIKKFSPVTEIWTSGASNKALSYLSHGIFRYFGKFPPPVARYLIKTYTRENDLVIDPMCGSGTSGLEALLLNRRAFGYDVNPLSVLISRVKVTPIKKEEYLATLARVIERAKKKRSSTGGPILIGLKNPEHWFLPETIRSLENIRSAIYEVEDKEIQDALMVAFLSIVRRVSRATTQQGRLFLDVKTAEKDALPFFIKKATEQSEQLSLLPKNSSVEVAQRSILDASNVDNEKSKLIICHPPYFNSYKYSGVNSLELSWLGVDHAHVRKGEVREAFKVGKAEKVDQYLDDMEAGLVNLRSYLVKNGRLALMIGDTVIKGQYIPVTKLLTKRLDGLYKIEKAALRIPKFTEASWAASQRRKGGDVGVNLCDLIVILQKI